MTKASNLLYLIEGALPDDFNGFDAPSVEIEKDSSYDTLRDLVPGDLFTIGNSKTVFECAKGSKGSSVKFATIKGTKGRKFYRIDTISDKPHTAGAFELITNSEFSKDSKVRPGIIRRA